MAYGPSAVRTLRADVENGTKPTDASICCRKQTCRVSRTLIVKAHVAEFKHAMPLSMQLARAPGVRTLAPSCMPRACMPSIFANPSMIEWCKITLEDFLFVRWMDDAVLYLVTSFHVWKGRTVLYGSQVGILYDMWSPAGGLRTIAWTFVCLVVDRQIENTTHPRHRGWCGILHYYALHRSITLALHPK